MTQFNNLQSNEPAFISHEKFVRTRPRGFHKTFTDCCYSLANLALIIAPILALVFCAKFLHEEFWFEYGEYLLETRYFNQLIYVIVVLPLVLIIPLFNAVAAFYLSTTQSRNGQAKELGATLIYIRLLYMILMVVLIFIALVFIGPYIRYGGVQSQLDLAIKNYMKRRYNDDFSWPFMDKVQSEYECCDLRWYRANFRDRVPDSCFKYRIATETSAFQRTCPDVLASIISGRCCVIAGGLVIILIALATLIGIDVHELISKPASGRHYDIRRQEQLEEQREPLSGSVVASSQVAAGKKQARGGSMDPEATQEERASLAPSSSSGRLRNNSEWTEDDADFRLPAGSSRARDEDPDSVEGSHIHNELVEELSTRLKTRAKEREAKRAALLGHIKPIISPKPTQVKLSPYRRADDEDWNLGYDREDLEITRYPSPTSPILTRANYLPPTSRPQSPLFLLKTQSNNENNDSTSLSEGLQTGSNRPPQATKGVLKKTSSFQRIDSSDNEEGINNNNDNEDQQLGIQRDTQTRRSLLNVRFDC